MAEIELRNISKSFGSTEVIKSLDLSVSNGEFITIVGPSGCGKSTLLRIIAGLLLMANLRVCSDSACFLLSACFCLHVSAHETHKA